MPKVNEIKNVADKKSKSSKDVPQLVLYTDAISAYNKAIEEAKAAKECAEALAPDLIAEGLSYVLKHNCEYSHEEKSQIKSVNLVEDGTGEKLQCTWTSRTSKINKAEVVAFFDGLTTRDGTPANVNKYAEERINAVFNTEAFRDFKGRFMQGRFDKFRAAIQIVAEELGIENPLSFNKEFVPTDEVPSLRFRELSLDQNLALQVVMPTSVSLKPIRSEEA